MGLGVIQGRCWFGGVRLVRTFGSLRLFHFVCHILSFGSLHSFIWFVTFFHLTGYILSCGSLHSFPLVLAFGWFEYSIAHNSGWYEASHRVVLVMAFVVFNVN